MKNTQPIIPNMNANLVRVTRYSDNDKPPFTLVFEPIVAWRICECSGGSLWAEPISTESISASSDYWVYDKVDGSITSEESLPRDSIDELKRG